MVTVNSGEFPLLRNIDIKHQPNRSRVYAAWARAFRDQVPWAVEHLGDVIEDVIAFDVWKEQGLKSPDEYFERLGLFGLDLEEPARLIKELRKRHGTKRAEIERRVKKVREMRTQGMTQQQIADQLGVSQPNVSGLLSENSVMTQKPDKEPRKRVVCQISQYTKAETAAAKIRDKFGDDFAVALAEALSRT